MPDFTLTPAQQVAFDLLFPVLSGDSKHELAVLEGSAGTGKSFLVAQLLAGLLQEEDRAIAVAAPTNKAVRVIKSMLEAAGVSVASAGEDNESDEWRGKPQRNPSAGCHLRSIHSFLGLQMKEEENGQQKAHKARDSSIHRYALLIVDETSMLSDDLFAQVLLERRGCRVLFVGDPAQLPPVGSHGLLSPVFDRVDLKARLSEVVRQAADNPIIRLSVALRAMIEANVKADPLALLSALPDVESGPKAALLAGTPEDVVSFFLAEYRADAQADTRIIAYTNARVLDYNTRIHRALHGDTGDQVFVPGEPVIVQSQGQGIRQCGNGVCAQERLITSEELTVLDCTIQEHPFYPGIPANRVCMKTAWGVVVSGYVPIHQGHLDQQVNALFQQWRTLKIQSAQASGDAQKRLKEQTADASGKGWALRRAFLNLRHAYAITAHKSQGSSFDCALVDFSDLNRMPDAFSFNRALYVAVTRSREFLALVVT